MKYTNNPSQFRVKGKTFRTAIVDIDVKARIWLFCFFVRFFWTKFMQKKLLNGMFEGPSIGFALPYHSAHRSRHLKLL